MKKFLLFLAVIAGLASCRKELLRGSGSVTTEIRQHQDFNGIKVYGSTNVIILKGNEFKVELKAYSNLLPHLGTHVENGLLVVKYKNDVNVRNDNSELYIHMPALTKLISHGSSDIEVGGDFTNMPSLTISKEGSGNIFIEHLDAEEVRIDLAGSGSVGDFGISGKKATLNISGSANIQLFVQEELNAKIRGSGNISYKGSPGKVSADIAGNGKLIKL